MAMPRAFSLWNADLGSTGRLRNHQGFNPFDQSFQTEI
ncbi:hypothetical protein SS05631_c33350 [Sinorhizobium sp. CCBAU 05631]|nr:hypothetical protein SS05631_c33350 [Sinorhizobium sp. CCBAU 05631]